MERINEFDSLRGMLAFWVLLRHIIIPVNVWGGEVGTIATQIFRGTYAVDVFIILSGFVIFYLLDDRKENYPLFIARRFFRLFPVYFFCFLFSVLFVDIFIASLESFPWEHGKVDSRLLVFFSSKDNLWSHILTHLFMLHGIIPDHILPYSAYAFLGPTYSISLEWQFYLIAPLIFLFYKKRGIIPLSTLLLFFILIQSKLNFLNLGPSFLGEKMPFFLIGMVSFHLWSNKKNQNKPSSNNLINIIIAAVIILNFPKSIPLAVWVIVFFSVTQSKTDYFQVVGKIVRFLLRLKILNYLGKISYSVYLSHYIIIHLIMYFLNDYAIDMGEHLYSAVLIVLVFLVTFIVSVLLYTFIEKPFIVFSKKVFIHKSINENRYHEQRY